MSTYTQILKQFQEKFKYNQFQKYELEQLSKKLDQLAKINCESLSFDPIIKVQILDIVPITYDKKIILRDFVSTIQKIFDVLSKYILEAQKIIETSAEPEDVAVHRQNIQQFTNDRQYLCNVFRLPIKRQSKIVKKIQDQELSQYQQSQTLKVALIILLIAIILQVITMLISFRFINCLVYSLALAVFILNFFDRSYIRVCILAFFASLIFDMLWCLKNTNFYLSSTENDFNLKFGTLTQIKLVMLKISFVSTILLITAKLIITLIFFRFRNNSIFTKKMVKLWNLRIQLDGKTFVSPISKLVMKNNSHQSNCCL